MSLRTQSGLPRGKGIAGGSSPPRRRVTRSQTREVEDHGHDARRRGFTGDGLEPVAESPFSYNSPRKPWKSPQKYRSPPVRQSLDWQDDPTNISGTTILPVDSEPDTEPDYIVMIETLPDLERMARDVLDFLVPRSADPVTIVNTAKRLGDPQGTQSRRLKRKTDNLMAQMKHFGNGTYIDGSVVNRAILPALLKNVADAGWRPDPVLQQANCARFALEVLLAGFGSSSRNANHAINNLEGRFPAPFMSGPVDSSLERVTFDLALEIRTQYLVFNLESRIHDHDFDPQATLNDVFCDEVMPDEKESYHEDQPPLRGFGPSIFEDQDGRLPERFKDAVYDRISDIRLALQDEENGLPNIAGLKGEFRWQSFALRAARWIRKREDAIAQELGGQRNTEKIVQDFLSGPQPRPSMNGAVDGPSRRGSLERTDTPASHVRQSSALSPAQNREPSRTDKPTAPRDQNTVDEAEKANRRKSGKSLFLNPKSIGRMMDRLRAPETEGRRESDSTGHNGTRSTEDRRQTLAAPERPGPEPQVPQSPRRSPQDPRRQTLAGFPESRRETTPERLVIPESHAGSPEYQPHDSPRFPDMDLEFEIPRFPVNENTASGEHRDSHGSRSNATGVSARLPTPSFESIWQSSRQREEHNASRPGPSHGDRTATPADAQRRAFIDRQKNAHRVSPITQDGIRSAERRHIHRPTKKTRDMFEVTNSDDTDGEDEFSQDGRTVNIASRRAQKPAQSSNKRRRTEQRHEPRVEPVLSGAARQPTSRPERRHELSLSPDRLRSPDRRAPRRRRRWTTDQDKVLIRYIEKYGCAWAQIHSIDNSHSSRSGGQVFEGRSQVQLKDRARNLKFKLQREGRPLPKNFEQVTGGNLRRYE